MYANINIPGTIDTLMLSSTIWPSITERQKYVPLSVVTALIILKLWLTPGGNKLILLVDSVIFIPLSLCTQYKTASVMFGEHEIVTEFPSSKVTDAKDLVSFNPNDLTK